MVRAGASSSFTQLRLLGGTATDATFSAIAKQIHRTNVRHLIIDGCAVEAGSSAWDVLKAASLETLAIDAESYGNCAELKKKTPTPTATTDDGFVHFAPVEMSNADYLLCGGGEDLNSSLIMMASPAAKTRMQQQGEYVTIVGSPAASERGVASGPTAGRNHP